jgi:hypothetical protein
VAARIRGRGLSLYAGRYVAMVILARGMVVERGGSGRAVGRAGQVRSCHRARA